MGLICGILGKRDAAVVRAMAEAMKHRGDPVHVEAGDTFTVACSACSGPAPCFVDGTPRDEGGSWLAPAELAQRCRDAQAPSALAVRGAFAAAVRLGDGEQWWLIRDRFGAKPLYYFQGRDFLLFASELKGILASGRVSKHLDLLGVDRYLTLRCVPGPETIIQGVRRVSPGHVLEYVEGRVTETRFSGFDLQVVDLPREEAARKVVDLLRRALGKDDSEWLLWSAGIDCAALAALKPRVSPVFVQLERGWHNEARQARESAKRLGLVLRKETARRITEDAFAKAVYHLDEPIADASVFPLWLVMQQACTHAPTLISGHGADELLGGYPRYHFLQKAKGAQALVPVTLLSGILPALPPNAFVRRGTRYLAAIRDSLEAYLSLLAVFDHGERAELYTDAMKAAVRGRNGSIGIIHRHFAEEGLTRSLLSLDLTVSLPDLLLTKCDRIAAAYGVSLSFPYLDDDLVDFVSTLSPNTKFGVRSKPLLRLGMKGLLPGRIRLRARRSFQVPQDGRVVRVIDSFTRQVVTQERCEAAGLFKWSYVQRVLRSATHNVYRRRQFWALLMFFAWYREIMES